MPFNPDLAVVDWEDDAPPDSERRPASQRATSLKAEWQPDVDKLQSWVSKIGEEPSPILLVEGPTAAHRSTVYRLVNKVNEKGSDQWVEQGIVTSLTQRMSQVRAAGSVIPHEWDVLWNLLTLENLLVEDPLRMLVDQGHLITSAFKALWEARFRLEEGQEVKTFVVALSRWMTGAPLDGTQRQLLGALGIERELETVFERLDMLFFLVTLAKQNDLVHELVFAFDGLDRVVVQSPTKRKVRLKELFDFCVSAERWSRLGAPVGFLLGYSKEHHPLDVIGETHPKLATKLRSYGMV